MYVCVCLDSFKYFWWTKITFFLILCPWGKKWVVNLFCQPSRKLNYWDFLFGYKKTKIKIYWIDMELLNCEWIYKYKNNDISAPVRLSVKFDCSIFLHPNFIIITQFTQDWLDTFFWLTLFSKMCFFPPMQALEVYEETKYDLDTPTSPYFW